MKPTGLKSAIIPCGPFPPGSHYQAPGFNGLNVEVLGCFPFQALVLTNFAGVVLPQIGPLLPGNCYVYYRGCVPLDNYKVGFQDRFPVLDAGLALLGDVDVRLPGSGARAAVPAQQHGGVRWTASPPFLSPGLDDACPQLDTHDVVPSREERGSALEEAKGYIYDSDLKRGDDHFRRVLSVSDVDTSEGLSLTMDVLPTTCPVSPEMPLEQVYSDACPTTTEEYDQIECHLKLDHSKTGQIECTYYGY
ncbi:hypothetical protein T10_5877 [Trichinella papuae]|uniref:Uncharacterized protein n=1 Tax=Trichinella papuae TaxID=268474 RepID=A0A0V1M6Y3_9BILA|nr:hypothetical protein T10_5877 [Trichinella papuae]